MNQIVTPPKNSNSIMEMTKQKRKVSLVMRAAFMMICALCFAIPAQAQQEVKMKNGSMTLPGTGNFLFYDSGGKCMVPMQEDPNDDRNWARMYQHNEGYELTFIPNAGTTPNQTGVKVTFNYLFVNDDFLEVYEGESSESGTKIGTYTNNDYSDGRDGDIHYNPVTLNKYGPYENNGNHLQVIANGPITFKFTSNGYWRDHGWDAIVEGVTSFVPTPPVVLMQKCSNYFEMIQTAANSTLYYTVGYGELPNDPEADPLNNTQVYNGNPVSIDGVTFPVYVKAQAKVGDQTSDIVTYIFEQPIQQPSAPHLDYMTGTNNVHVWTETYTGRDTYYVRYTTSGEDPTMANQYSAQNPDGYFEIKQNSVTKKIDTILTFDEPCTIKAVKRGTTCPQNFSEIVTVEIEQIFVPEPKITFDGDGNTTITCSLPGTTIYYTTDGSIPDPNHVGTGYPTQQYTGEFPVSLGTTVQALAVMLEHDGYQPSPVAHNVYVGNGSGVSGDVVLLDDREYHSWSYYSDPDQPIHSLNPADVKITYFGNGTGTVSTTDGATPANNSWTANATGVQVGPNEAGNQFIYLKTLENDDPEGEDNKYSYTTIPNPFSKRPTYSNVVATRNIYVRGTIQQDAFGYINVTYTDVNNTQQTWSGYINWSQQQGSIYPEATLQVLAGTTVSFSLYTSNGGFNNNPNSHIGCEVRYDDANGEVIWNGTAYWQNNNQSNPVTGSITVQEGGSSGGSITVADYRGFYAWRVKRVSSGLTIKRANGTTVNVGGIINAEEALQFVTSKENGNEVDFEALWAKAYVVRYDSDNAVTVTNTTVGFERNFVVLARNYNDFTLGGDNNRLNNPNNRAVTISSYYPDGTVGANRCGIDFGGDLDLNYDLKLEYIQNNDYDNSGYYINANGHYLCIGRGMTTGSTIAAQINAIRRPSNGDIVTIDASNTRIRLESGNYSHIEVLAGEYGYSGQPGRRFHTLMTFGTDYDRATKDNNKLTVAPTNGEITFGNRYPLNGDNNGERRINASVNRGERTFTCITKSGKFQQDQFENTIGSNTQSFYIGTTGESNSYSGKRYLTVEGGEFACIAGGRGPKASDDDNTYPTITEQYVDRNDTTATIRIKKDAIIHGGVYGGAAASPAWGHRKIIITGGTIEGWVAGGCNGTQQQNYGGRGIGDAYIYVGGNAIIGGEHPHTIPNVNNIPGTVGGNVFGTGRGSYGGESVPSSMENSYVVIADSCDILHSVYGGGNLGRVFEGEGHAANVYILGGTIHEDVYGGANLSNSQMAFIHIKDGVVEGNVYGGSNTNGTANGKAVVNMTGGRVGGSVFGGGKGGPTAVYAGTIMMDGTEVNISGGTINNNVYGGGEEGSVLGVSDVTFSGGTVQNVFGAGLGTAASAFSDNANVRDATKVTINGGTISNSVFGGGMNGSVGYNVSGSNSLVEVNGGTIGVNVYGGGNNGFTNGPVTVNINGGTVKGAVFGGAFGQRNKVYVAGQRTVNMRGGTVETNVYGGSRNADDALSFNPGAFGSSNEKRHASVVNISGGHVFYQVFASGYFGHVYGSTYAFIGTNAIMNAPNHIATTDGTYNEAYYNNHQALQIDGSVWAGGDFGSFDGSKFGDPTITGLSCIYIDGTGYDTESTNVNSLYMNIAGSLYGCGTSCDGGKVSRRIIVRDYGQLVENPNWSSKNEVVEPYTSATRSLYSIQRADTLDINNSHVNFFGQGKVSSLVSTEHYTIHEFGWVRLSGGSSLFLNAPVDQIQRFGSYKVVDDVYDKEPKYIKIEHAGQTSTLAETPNKIRINNGTFIMIHHNGETVGGHTYTTGYGQLEGFAYMMTEGENEICAYARPRQGTDAGNTINESYDNPLDGGWVSYNDSYNTFYDSGSDGCGTSGSGLMQMPYENHTFSSKNGEQYFRIWRYGEKYLYREGVFVAQSDGSSNYSTVDAYISLPTSLGEDSYFRIQSLSDGNTTIDYGADVMTVNAAYTEEATNANGNHWMFYDVADNGDHDFHYGFGIDDGPVASARRFIDNNPNVNFGLVAIPQGTIAGDSTLLFSEDGDKRLAKARWENNEEGGVDNAGILFRLTYNNGLTNNVVWDPVTIVFEHVNSSGEVKEVITVKLTVTTLTNIQQHFSAEVYALMRGNGDPDVGTYVTKVVLPSYVTDLYEMGELSQWTCQGVQWEPNTNSVEVGTEDFPGAFLGVSGNHYLGQKDRFAMEFAPSTNFDESTGWDEYYQGEALDSHNWYDNVTPQNNPVLGNTTARDPIAFDFTLYFDKGQRVDGNVLMGTLTFNMQFTNYKTGTGTTHVHNVPIDIKVWRVGPGRIYYLDGVHGNNLYSGTFPNAAKSNLSGIFNRTDYRYGDYICIVNTVTVEGDLEWNGKQYQEVTLYRYPGRHKLADDKDYQMTSYWSDYDYENNGCFTGTLVKVGSDDHTGNMTMNGIVLNGFHDMLDHQVLYPQVDHQDLYWGSSESITTDWTGQYVNPSSPMVEITEGSTLSMYGQSSFVGNYNQAGNGGAVNNAGTFNFYDGSSITGNAVADGNQGGGIYMAPGSKLQLSDLVTIDGNHIFTAGDDSQQDKIGIDNNVYLPQFVSTVTVGTEDETDAYKALDNASRIGITSLPENEWYYQDNQKWYLPVAFSDGGLDGYLQNIIDNGVIFDDKDEYEVVSLNVADWTNVPTNYLYFVGTWVTAVKKNPQNPDEPNTFNYTNIDTENELAWLISYVNGLNGADAHPGITATLAADLDMDAHIWVPIGSAKVNFRGQFDGNGHVVTGLRSPLNNNNMGMFGITDGATISNLIAQADFTGGTMKNIGTIIGTMQGGKLCNVEASGVLTGTDKSENIGGLVGLATTSGSTKPVIHSGFAVNTLIGGANTKVGGLVGTNGADLYNSYANVTMGSSNAATTLGGLVGINQTGCTVENCYVINPIGPAFAYTNNGNINYCYGAKPAEGVTVSYVADGTQPTTHGTYDVVKGRKEIGYMYYDNVAEIVGTGENNYIKSEIGYAGGRISTWSGLLSSLNQWVSENPKSLNPIPTTWFRPTSDTINGDLPVLGFPKDNALGTLSSDGKFLRYGSNVDANGVDELLAYYNDNNDGDAEPKANLFHYGKATGVANVPSSNVYVFLNEDAVLKQAANAGDFTNTIVGITFDNSYKSASDYFGNGTGYDWHFLSSSLTEAPMGITYGKEGVTFGYGNPADISVMEGNYFPDSLMSQSEVAWDLYSFYEPQYHWINLKRSSTNHWHFDEPHGNIEYTNETIFTPGKGYMAAISQDSYLNNTGTLNKADFTIGVTSDSYDPGITEIGYNLLGNPYQAYLDMSAFMNNTNNKALFENSYWVYIAEGDNYIAGNFAASDNVALPSGTLHPHQAFFVKVKQNNGSNTGKDGMAAQFTYGMATANAQAYSFFRDNKVNYPLVNLKANNERGMQDLAVIEFNRPEMGGSNKLRALNNASFELCSHMDGEDYSILFAPEGTERVPVRFRTKEDGTFTLTWETMHGEFSSLLLVDNMTGTVTDMLRAERYTFDAGADDYASRFYITYRVTDVDEHGEGDGTFAWFDGSEWIVEGQGVLDVVDVMGRTVYLNGVAKGVYLLRVSDGTNTMVQKIVVR